MEDPEEIDNSGFQYPELSDHDVSEVLELCDVLWESRENPSQAKLLYQSITRFKKEQALGDAEKDLGADPQEGVSHLQGLAANAARVKALKEPFDQNDVDVRRFNTGHVTIGEFNKETEVGFQPNLQSLESTYNQRLDLSYNYDKVLHEAEMYEEEIDLKIDKLEDVIEMSKEEQLDLNLKSLERSLNLIEEFKRFNFEQDK